MKMEQIAINDLFQNTEGYFSFGHVHLLVIDQEIIFLNLSAGILWYARHGYLSNLKRDIKELGYPKEEILETALKYNHVDIVKYVLDQSRVKIVSSDITMLKSVGQYDEAGSLRKAFEDRRLDTVKYIIERNDSLIYSPLVQYLKMAITEGNIRLTKYFIRMGWLDLNNAVKTAVYYHQLEILDFLLGLVDTSLINQYYLEVSVEAHLGGNTAVYYYFIDRFGFSEVMHCETLALVRAVGGYFRYNMPRTGPKYYQQILLTSYLVR